MHKRAFFGTWMRGKQIPIMAQRESAFYPKNTAFCISLFCVAGVVARRDFSPEPCAAKSDEPGQAFGRPGRRATISRLAAVRFAKNVAERIHAGHFQLHPFSFELFDLGIADRRNKHFLEPRAEISRRVRRESSIQPAGHFRAFQNFLRQRPRPSGAVRQHAVHIIQVRRQFGALWRARPQNNSSNARTTPSSNRRSPGRRRATGPQNPSPHRAGATSLSN